MLPSGGDRQDAGTWVNISGTGRVRGGGGQEKIMTGRGLEFLLKSGIRRNGEISRQCLIFRNPKRGLSQESRGGNVNGQLLHALKLPTTPIWVLTVSDETKRATFEVTKVPQFKTSGQKVVSETILFF